MTVDAVPALMKSRSNRLRDRLARPNLDLRAATHKHTFTTTGSSALGTKTLIQNSNNEKTPQQRRSNHPWLEFDLIILSAGIWFKMSVNQYKRPFIEPLPVPAAPMKARKPQAPIFTAPGKLATKKLQFAAEPEEYHLPLLT